MGGQPRDRETAPSPPPQARRPTSGSPCLAGLRGPFPTPPPTPEHPVLLTAGLLAAGALWGGGLPTGHSYAPGASSPVSLGADTNKELPKRMNEERARGGAGGGEERVAAREHPAIAQARTHEVQSQTFTHRPACTRHTVHSPHGHRQGAHAVPARLQRNEPATMAVASRVAATAVPCTRQGTVPGVTGRRSVALTFHTARGPRRI